MPCVYHAWDGNSWYLNSWADCREHPSETQTWGEEGGETMTSLWLFVLKQAVSPQSCQCLPPPGARALQEQAFNHRAWVLDLHQCCPGEQSLAQGCPEGQSLLPLPSLHTASHAASQPALSPSLSHPASPSCTCASPNLWGSRER